MDRHDTEHGAVMRVSFRTCKAVRMIDSRGQNCACAMRNNSIKVVTVMAAAVYLLAVFASLPRAIGSRNARRQVKPKIAAITTTINIDPNW